MTPPTNGSKDITIQWLGAMEERQLAQEAKIDSMHKEQSIKMEDLRTICVDLKNMISMMQGAGQSQICKTHAAEIRRMSQWIDRWGTRTTLLIGVGIGVSLVLGWSARYAYDFAKTLISLVI